MRIFKEKPGVISEDALWVCFDSYYMYTEDTLLGLLWLVISEWRKDRHLIG